MEIKGDEEGLKEMAVGVAEVIMTVTTVACCARGEDMVF